MSIKTKFSQLFLTPSGSISRKINIAVQAVTAFTSLGAFYFIKFVACIEVNCTESSLPNLINTLSPLFLVYGICCLIVAIFISKHKNIASIYTDSISLISSIGIIIILVLALSIK
jgi:hypothetical protein